eukprot:4409326-Amphidinium_carterae.2
MQRLPLRTWLNKFVWQPLSSPSVATKCRRDRVGQMKHCRVKRHNVDKPRQSMKDLAMSGSQGIDDIAGSASAEDVPDWILTVRVSSEMWALRQHASSFAIESPLTKPLVKCAELASKEGAIVDDAVLVLAD